MTNASKLDSFLHNPEDLPTDPEEIARMVLGEGDPTDEQNQVVEGENKNELKTDDQSVTKDGDDKVGDDKVEGDKPKEESPQGVLTKDGRHVIPYAVLESERRAKADAERIASEAQAQVTHLSEQLRLAKEGKGDDTGKTQQATVNLLAQIDELTEEVPALRDVLKPLVETVTNLQGEVTRLNDEAAQLKQRAKQEDDTRAKTVEEAVDEAIDRNPYLRYWRAEDSAAWQRAVALDQTLRRDPANAHLTFDKRFEKVVSGMHALYGKEELPEAYRPKQPDAGNTRKSDDKESAEAKGARKKDETFTLSDLPGGVSPNKDDRRYEEMTVGELFEKVDSQLERGVPVDQIIAQFG